MMIDLKNAVSTISCYVYLAIFITSSSPPIASFADNGQPVANPHRGTTYIQGRIEAILKPGATLPEELTMPKFNAESAKLDNSLQPRKLRINQTSIEGSIDYPSYLLGLWGGDFTVDSTIGYGGHHDPRVGDVGTAIFHFIKPARLIELKPVRIFFSMQEESPDERQHDQMSPGNIDYLHRLDNLNKGKVVEKYTTCPVIPLGGYTTSAYDGSRISVNMISNSLRILRPGLVEGDVVTSHQWQPVNGNATMFYEEVITRFTWLGNGHVNAHIARVLYASDRKVQNLVMLHGLLAPNWQDYADKIASKLQRPWDDIEKRYNL